VFIPSHSSIGFKKIGDQGDPTKKISQKGRNSEKKQSEDAGKKW